MITWLQLTDGQRKAVIDQAEQLSGITAKAIEKDWWVTLSLKALFQSKYRDYMVFKGGTSLSKCWNLIARFSEDIDIALDPQAFGMEYLEEPGKNHVDKLRKMGCSFTSNELRQEIENQLAALGLPNGLVTVEAAPVPANRTDTDPQTLFLQYPSLYDANDYIADQVKIEVSVRSLRMPFATVPIQSLLTAINPNPAYAETPFPVEVVEPRKTFLEKIFLLHEEFSKPDKTKIRTQRMSRHLYDLVKMMHTKIGEDALADHDLYDHLIHHRKKYIRLSQFDYASLGHATISFVPSDEVIEDYKKDYETMQEQMIYENAVPFDELIADLKSLQGRVRFKYEGDKALFDIVAIAREALKDSAELETGNYYEFDVESKKQGNDSADSTAVVNRVTFLYQNGRLVFENISTL